MPELLRAHGEDGPTPRIMGAVISVQFVWFLFRDGAEPAEPTDRLAACFVSGWAVQPRLRDVSFEGTVQARQIFINELMKIQ